MTKLQLIGILMIAIPLAGPLFFWVLPRHIYRLYHYEVEVYGRTFANLCLASIFVIPAWFLAALWLIERP